MAAAKVTKTIKKNASNDCAIDLVLTQYIPAENIEIITRAKATDFIMVKSGTNDQVEVRRAQLAYNSAANPTGLEKFLNS